MEGNTKRCASVGLGHESLVGRAQTGASFEGFSEHWNSLTVRERRIAEEAAIENWNDPELLEFSKKMHELALLKKHLLSEWISVACPSSAKTGVVVSVEVIQTLFKTAYDELEVMRGFHQRLFRTREYRLYVLKVADQICLTDPDALLALNALRDAVIPHVLASDFSETVAKQLSCVCKAFYRSYERNYRGEEMQ